MPMNKTFEMITSKASEAEKQLAEITRKMDVNKAEKAKAERAKAAALQAKDEQAYKAACRAIADADAGIEFNTICMQEAKKKQLASDADDQKIKAGLQLEIKGIYSSAIDEMEKALISMQDIADGAIKKLAAIDAMANTWDAQVMKKPRPAGAVPITASKVISLQQFFNAAGGRLEGIKTMRKADPMLQK